ncbi:MAG: hypothetical protein HY985_09750 [Magnetospirillum sp.]|nr:hypothetical protein [Magnetospirillum sp.]
MTLALALLSLLALGALLYGPWQTFWEDWGRQRLFEVRDEIFDMAADKRMEFNNAQYITIRQSLNYAIRFMHQLTWLRILYIYLSQRLFGVPFRASALEQAIDQIPERHLRSELEDKMVRVGRIMLYVVIMRSPLLVMLLAVLYPIALVADKIIAFGFAAQRQDAYTRSFKFVQRDAEIAEASAAA